MSAIIENANNKTSIQMQNAIVIFHRTVKVIKQEIFDILLKFIIICIIQTCIFAWYTKIITHLKSVQNFFYNFNIPKPYNLYMNGS